MSNFALSPIHSKHSKKDILISSRKNQKLYDNESIKMKNKSCLKLISSGQKWFWIMNISFLIIITIVAIALISTIASYTPSSITTFNYTSNSSVGKPCLSTSDCIVNAYCYMNSSTSRIGLCTCVNTYYFDLSTSLCTQRKTFNQSCSNSDECLDNKSLTCISSYCLCDTSIRFWNYSALECQYKKVPLAICQSNWGDCPSNSVCTNSWPLNVFGYTRCICNGNWWFNTNTGVCEYRKVVGASCTYDYECFVNSYCTTTTTSSTKVCVCDPYYYNNNGVCSQKIQSIGTGCSLIDQCNLIQNNLRCISSTCRCDNSSEVWDSFYLKCVTLKRYGETCTTNSNCQIGYNFVCTSPVAGGTRNACLCPSTMYFDVVSGSCTTRKLYNVQCNSRLECNNPDLMICSTYNGGITKRCLCIPNYSYLNIATNTCVLKKSYLSACVNDYECQDYLGFQCLLNTCKCPSTKYYDTTTKQCLWLKRYHDTCDIASQCASGICCSSQYCC